MKENISVSLKNVSDFVPVEEIVALARQSVRHLDMLNNGTGPGSDFLGWLSLPQDIEPQLDRIEKSAQRLREISDTTVVIGIGGSYLGTRAVIDSLSHSFSSLMKKKSHEILYAGQNIAEDYLSELIDLLNERDYSIVAISKSGTTTESAIGLRILKDHLEKKAGAKASERSIAITDSSKGALRTLANKNGYETFIIPDDIGGRYSVLSPVGLLPIAISGLNIREIIRGAQDMEKLTRH